MIRLGIALLGCLIFWSNVYAVEGGRYIEGYDETYFCMMYDGDVVTDVQSFQGEPISYIQTDDYANERLSYRPKGIATMESGKVILFDVVQDGDDCPTNAMGFQHNKKMIYDSHEEKVATIRFARNVAKWKAARAWASKNGMSFRVWTRQPKLGDEL